MKKLLILVFSISYLVFCIKTTYADSPSITVSPSLLQIDLALDQPTADLFYKNTSANPVDINLSAKDFKDLNDGWQVNFLAPKDAANYKYSLSSWISFDKKSLTIPPGKEEKVTVTIDAARLAQGGHYASIQAEIKSKPTDRRQVQIDGILSSLLFVRAGVGKIREEAKINQFGAIRDNFWDFPNMMLMRFENSGNVDLTPFGLIEIKDIFGNTIAKGILNEGSFITLPESIRRYDIPVKPLSNFFLPGIYHAKITLHFGKSNKYIYKEASFFSQGSLDWILIIPATVAVLIAVKLIFKRRKTAS